MKTIQKVISIIKNFLFHNIFNMHNYKVRKSLLYDTVSFGQGCFIKNAIIKGTLKTGRKCKLIECDLSGVITLGNYTTIMGPNTLIRGKINPITIGSFCSIARSVHFQEYSHKINRLSTYFVNFNLLGGSLNDDIVSKGGITIGNDVWIGAGAILLSGVTVGNGVIIAANSVVTKDVPDYAIVAGMPAKLIRYRFDEAIIKRLNEWQWWNFDDDRLKELTELFSVDVLTVEKLTEYMESK